MGPEGGEVGILPRLGNPGGDRLDEHDNPEPTEREPDHPHQGGNDRHHAEQLANRAEERSYASLRASAQSGGDGQRDSEDQADPPGGDDPPGDPLPGRRVEDLAREDWRVADGEIFEADAGRNLVVRDPIGDCRKNAEDDDRQGSHEHHLTGWPSGT
jgi:hypothetical protein